MMDGINKVNQKLTSFKRKYYYSLLLRGLLLTLSLLLFYFLIASLVEYSLWLSGWARFTIFSLFFILVIFCVFKFLKEPLVWWLYRRGIGQEESAKMIGSYFPHIQDRLLNLIQLGSVRKQSTLLEAGIAQRAQQFEHVAFENAIDLRANTRYLKYFLVPFLLIVLIFIFNRGILTQSTKRIVEFNHEFSPQAPFRFMIQNKTLDAFLNEDFTLRLKLDGEALPDAVYLQSNTQRLKLESSKPGEFEYTFEKIQNEIPFHLEASGFNSNSYKIELVNRPELTQLKMMLEFPRYINRRNEELLNTGNVEVPEGTRITWQIRTSYATKAFTGFSSETSLNSMQNIDNQVFTFKKGIRNSERYWIELENDHSKNKDKINYSIQVVKDQYPAIEVDHLKDSVLYKTIFLGGNINDDYGLTELSLNYQIIKQEKTENKRINILLNRNSLQQSFFYQWHLDSLRLQPGDKLNYYLQVWDNDGVNGRKSSKSSVYFFALPGEEELKTEISNAQSAAENKMDASLKKAKNLREAIDATQQKLKGKQLLDWQDKKMLEDLMEQKKSLDQAIEQLQKQNELLEKKKDSFADQNEKIREKAQQIQKLMDQLLDPETKKLFEELEKLLKQNADMNQVQKMLDKMDRKEINLEKELERTLELFKQIQFDYKLDRAIQDIKEQKERQEHLLQKTEELTGDKKEEADPEGSKQGIKANEDERKDSQGNKGEKKDGEQHDEKSISGQDKNQKPDVQDLAKKQEENIKEAETFQKELNELGKLAEELKKETQTPSPDDINQLKESEQQSKESLNQRKPKKSIESQKKSIKQMSQMQQQLEGMQSSMEMDIDTQNMETLRRVVHGLIKLSFNQESLMKDFNQIQQTDPKYIQLSQNQLRIKDDSKVLDDSLLSLAKRDPFMSSIVTKEIGELDDHLDKAAEHIRERRKPNASSEMQLSMTSINNLALMLNDHYDMIMDMIANSMPMPGKKKGKQPQSSLSKMQQQLNMKIQDLKNGGKSGRQYSEELAKAAAEQERIRRALQEMQEKLKQDGGKSPGDDLAGKMEQTEMDLVNKQITEQTIRRQKEIETRLLESEKSMREQDMDQERKGETAKDYDKEIPKAFEEYLRLKEKEVELLKSMPPKLYPYYKKEVNEYFKRIKDQN